MGHLTLKEFFERSFPDIAHVRKALKMWLVYQEYSRPMLYCNVTMNRWSGKVATVEGKRGFSIGLSLAHGYVFITYQTSH